MILRINPNDSFIINKSDANLENGFLLPQTAIIEEITENGSTVDESLFNLFKYVVEEAAELQTNKLSKIVDEIADRGIFKKELCIKILGAWIYNFYNLKNGNKKGMYEFLVDNAEIIINDIYVQKMTLVRICGEFVFVDLSPKVEIDEAIQWLKISEAVAKVKLSTYTIRKAINNKKLVAFSYGNKMTRIEKSELDNWVERGYEAPERIEKVSFVKPPHKYLCYQAAFQLNVSETFIYDLVRRNVIPTVADPAKNVEYYIENDAFSDFVTRNRNIKSNLRLSIKK